MYNRRQYLGLSSSETCFLWGPRQVGKSTLLKQLFPEARYYDLLLATEYERLIKRPSLLREELEALELTGKTQQAPIIIDEVQKLPALLDEVHWLIENKGLRFLLCGSSARKMKRGHANLLGGRAVRYELFPLVFPEIDDFTLDKALNQGLIPRHYDTTKPQRLLQSYVVDYLKEEIAAEGLTRNVPAFGRFLEVAALTNGEILNYSNIAMESGISSVTVKEYFQILEDTLIGSYLPSFTKRAKRRVIKSPKFYFFDIGVVAYLTRRGIVEPGSELFGKAFEHFIYTELRAHSSYNELFYPITYWHTSSHAEVDFILDNEVAIEVKATDTAHNRHLKGLRSFKKDHPKFRRYILVSLDPTSRKTEDGIDIIPWRTFLEHLWEDMIIS